MPRTGNEHPIFLRTSGFINFEHLENSKDREIRNKPASVAQNEETSFIVFELIHQKK